MSRLWEGGGGGRRGSITLQMEEMDELRDALPLLRLDERQEWGFALLEISVRLLLMSR